MKQTSSETNKNVFVKSVLSSLLISILQDPEMTSEFVVENAVNNQEQHQYKTIIKHIEEEAIIGKQFVQKQESKCNKSRLQIQIEKNQFNMTAISGQVFFLLVQAFLQGKKSEQHGKIMLTNYRVLFFKDQLKRVDLPFGRIGRVEYFQKQTRIVYHLKYPHIWRFRVPQGSKFMQLKNVGDIYYKTDTLRKVFAFEYAFKIMPIPEPYRFSITDEYKRLRFDRNHQNIDFVGQEHYNICPTYPSTFHTAVCHQTDLYNLASHRRNRRLPILAYKYFPNDSKQQVPLWVSSSYEQLKSYNKVAQKDLLNLLKCDMKLQVFVAEIKNAKQTDENYFQKSVSVTYLKLQGNDQLSLAENHLFQVFLANKKPFIKQIINSKWYTYLSNILDACHTLRNHFLQENAILIRCQSGFDKSLLLASLLQIIIHPYFRTFKGFQALVMRMFVHYGHPFTERLGLLSSNAAMCPIFLQFLDCVSQLINQNPQSFQFNFKYLAKISTLMQLNIYGTFLANSSKEYKESRIEVQTCSIWTDIISPITTNGFYNKKGGFLEVDSGLSAMRIWKEHFGDMISRNKDHYRFEQTAEDNDDYLNLYCLRLKEQNRELMVRMKQKMGELQRLQRQLRQRQGNK